jgi:hypothetical protein
MFSKMLTRKYVKGVTVLCEICSDNAHECSQNGENPAWNFSKAVSATERATNFSVTSLDQQMMVCVFHV